MTKLKVFKPKITGLLNNCSMYCGLPILLEKIAVLATLETDNKLPADDDVIFKHYKKLKDVFAQYYGIKNIDLLTWEKFNNFLIIHQLFLEKEIILLPVFRHFIADIGIQNDYHDQDLWNLKDIQSNDRNHPNAIFWTLVGDSNPNAGRYNPLDGNEVFKLFYQPLGISTQVYEFNEGTKQYPLQNSYTCSSTTDWFGETPNVSMYLKHGHYEIQPHEDCNTDNYVFEVNTLQGKIYEIQELLSTSDDDVQTNEGLGQLLLYVREELNKIIENSAIIDAHMSAQDYAVFGEQLHNNTPSGRQTFAVILLIICLATHEGNARLLLSKIKTLSSQSEWVADELAQAIINSKGDLDSLDINQLILQADAKIVAIHDYNFQFKCILGLAGAGVILVGLAIVLTCPPLAMMGVLSAIALGTTGFGSIATSIGLFANLKNPTEEHKMISQHQALSHAI